MSDCGNEARTTTFMSSKVGTADRVGTDGRKLWQPDEARAGAD
jgi:hypothetical protein